MQVKEEWGKLPAELSKTRDVLTFDNQGIGASTDEATRDFTLDLWCQDIVALVEVVFGTGVRFGVLGFSMGAFAAQHLAAAAAAALPAGRVTAAVLLGGQGDRAGAVAGDGAFFGLASKTLPSGQDSFEANERRLRYFFSEQELGTHSPEEWKAIVTHNLQFDRPKSTIKKQLRVLGSADVNLSGITAPTLVVYGEHDNVVPAANGDLLMAQLCSAVRRKLVVMPGQAHMCWGASPPNTQKIPAATHVLARHIEAFLSGDSCRL
eukprot:COSAG01_NODE_3072_length_6637_cov_10.406087_2_plen_264_part_00